MFPGERASLMIRTVPGGGIQRKGFGQPRPIQVQAPAGRSFSAPPNAVLQKCLASVRKVSPESHNKQAEQKNFLAQLRTAGVGLPRPHFSNILSSLPPPHVVFTPGLHHPPSLESEKKGMCIWELPWRRGEESFPRTPGKHLAFHWSELGHVPFPEPIRYQQDGRGQTT